jgi:hypothetical protein
MTRSFGFYQEKASSKKETYLFDKFDKATKNVCTSTILVSPDPLSLTSASVFSFVDSKKHRRGP